MTTKIELAHRYRLHLTDADWQAIVAEGVDAPPAGDSQPQTEERKGPRFTTSLKQLRMLHPSRRQKTMARKAPAARHLSTVASHQAMTARQYVAACEKLGVSPGYGAARVLGISKDMAQRYTKDQWPVPATVAKLLRALVALGRTEV
jgi:hypothetical protein